MQAEVSFSTPEAASQLSRQSGPLRDVVERQKLEAYIRTYGDFDDLWMPWKV